MNMPAVQIDGLDDEFLILSYQNDIDLCDRLEIPKRVRNDKCLLCNIVGRRCNADKIKCHSESLENLCEE